MMFKVFQLVGIPITAFMLGYCAASLYGNPPVENSDVAAWAQATGAILAICAAFAIASDDTRRARREKESDAIFQNARSSAILVEVAVRTKRVADDLAYITTQGTEDWHHLKRGWEAIRAARDLLTIALQDRIEGDILRVALKLQSILSGQETDVLVLQNSSLATHKANATSNCVVNAETAARLLDDAEHLSRKWARKANELAGR